MESFIQWILIIFFPTSAPDSSQIHSDFCISPWVQCSFLLFVMVSLCCFYIQGCETIHWNMSNQPGTVLVIKLSPHQKPLAIIISLMTDWISLTHSLLSFILFEQGSKVLKVHINNGSVMVWKHCFNILSPEPWNTMVPETQGWEKKDVITQYGTDTSSQHVTAGQFCFNQSPLDLGFTMNKTCGVG